MTTENSPLHEIRNHLETEDRGALSRVRTGIILRALLIVVVVGYMTWISSAVSKLDAEELTRIAAAEIEERLPEMRAELRDYAIRMAPDLTDHAKEVFLELPGQMRQFVEAQLLAKTDELIAQFEADVDGAITVVIEDQIRLVKAGLPGASPEQQLDALVLGVSDIFRETMIEAIDELYIGYAGEVRTLNARLDRLLTGHDLTESEKIDKQLIEAWMVLVHKHDIANSSQLVASF